MNRFRIWNVVGLMNFTFILSGPISIQGREFNLGDFLKKKKKTLNVDLHSHIFRVIFFKLGVMTDSTTPYCLIPV